MSRCRRRQGEILNSDAEPGDIGLLLGVTVKRGDARPVSLGGFRNTPMEAAIRDCVQQASEYITSSTPRKYFRHD